MATGAAPALEHKMSKSPGMMGMAVFGVALIVGLIYTVVSLARDLQAERGTSIFPYVLLGVALLVALAF
jgi:inorganic phosphate transporter, PiT family